MKFKTRSGIEFEMDEADALNYVGVPLWVSSHGYLKDLSDNRKEGYVHRAIMGAAHGDYVDHIDGNPLNNSRSNLRICTQSQNMYNQKIQKHNKSGKAGVYWDKQRLKWSAQIRVNKKTIGLGRFDNIADAFAARRSAEETYYGEFRAERGCLNENKNNQG